MTFNYLAQRIHQTAQRSGFYDHDPQPTEKLILIVSETVEVVEALRSEDTAREAEELADVVIRCLDYAAWRGIDLDFEVRKKMEKNKGRPYRHGKAF